VALAASAGPAARVGTAAKTTAMARAADRRRELMA
jgi:hypothetical protein